jgi:hypothetical protein
MSENEISEQKSFGEKADKFLAELYHSCGAVSTAQKINVLNLKLGGEYNFYARGGEVTDDIKLACLEYELLQQEKQIPFMTLA